MGSFGVCHAALGEKRAVVTSAGVGVVGAQLRAQTPSLQMAGVTSQSTQHPNGTTVVEYAAKDGIVFAVTWQGPVLPDLPAQLGTFFPQFRDELQRLGSGSRLASVLNLRTVDLVVHSQGRMRHFSGYAYAPSLVPAGLDVLDVVQ